MKKKLSLTLLAGIFFFCVMLISCNIKTDAATKSVKNGNYTYSQTSKGIRSTYNGKSTIIKNTARCSILNLYDNRLYLAKKSKNGKNTTICYYDCTKKKIKKLKTLKNTLPVNTENKITKLAHFCLTDGDSKSPLFTSNLYYVNCYYNKVYTLVGNHNGYYGGARILRDKCHFIVGKKTNGQFTSFSIYTCEVTGEKTLVKTIKSRVGKYFSSVKFTYTSKKINYVVHYKKFLNED